MLKAVFLETCIVQATNGPTYEKGKAYWLTPDQFQRWDRRGKIRPAPEEQKAENAPYGLVAVGRREFDVLGPDNTRLNDRPLSQEEAEAFMSAQKAQQSAPALEVRPAGMVEIPTDWQSLPWPELQKLATSINPEWGKRKDEALAAIEAELAVRAAGTAPDGGEGDQPESGEQDA